MFTAWLADQDPGHVERDDRAELRDVADLGGDADQAGDGRRLRRVRGDGRHELAEAAPDEPEGIDRALPTDLDRLERRVGDGRVGRDRGQVRDPERALAGGDRGGVTQGDGHGGGRPVGMLDAEGDRLAGVRLQRIAQVAATERIEVLAVDADDLVTGHQTGRGRQGVRLDRADRDADGQVPPRRCR